MNDANIAKLTLQKMQTELKGQKYPWKDALDFFENPKFIGAHLYPNQRLLLKLWNLYTDYTDKELETLEKWTQGFANESYRSGVSTNVRERIAKLREQGAEWFPIIVEVMGRRSGKTFMTGLQLSYCLACYLWTEGFGMNTSALLNETDKLGHAPMLVTMATTESQGAGTIYSDLARAVAVNRFFDPYVVRSIKGNIEFATLTDQLEFATKEDRITERPLSILVHNATSKASGIRGWAIPFYCFDEAFFALGGEGERSGNAALEAALPATKQFYPHSMAIFPSSPRSRTEGLYKVYEEGLHSDSYSTLICQMESWRMYEGSDDPVVEAPDPDGDEKAQDMALTQRNDPIGFRVEYCAQFADSSYVYYDPDNVKAIFTLPNANMVGQRGVVYRIHCDPARVNDDFSIMVAHMEGTTLKVDYYTVFRAANFPNHTIDYNTVANKIKGLILSFSPISVTFDQYNSAMLIDTLSQYVRSVGVATRVFEETATKDKNTDVYQKLKIAINSHQVESYTDSLNTIEKDRCLLEASLDMVQERDGKIYKPRIPGYGHLDLVDCLAVLNAQFRNAVVENMRKDWAKMGGLDPWQQTWF